MKQYMHLIYLLFTPLMLVATHTDSNLSAYEDTGTITVKVLIKENIEGSLIDVKGGYKVFNPLTNKSLSSGFSGKRYYLQTNSAGLKWGEGYPGIHQIKIVPTSPLTSILVDGIQYRGAIEVYDVNSKVQIVNEVDVEDYLKSVLSSQLTEDGTRYLSNTLEAVAVIARTHLYHMILNSPNPYWDIQAEEAHYLGFGATLVHPEVDKAVNATKNLILTYNSKPFATTWSENCAGQTASYSHIFRKTSSGPEGVTVPFAQKQRELHRWKCTLSNEELSDLLRLPKLTTIDLYQESCAKKVYAVRFSNGLDSTEIPFLDLQKLLGPDRLASNDFTVRQSQNLIIFEGYGRGVGVGLCLLSADQMARVGNSTPQILNHFYPTSYLIKLSSFPENFMIDPPASADEPKAPPPPTAPAKPDHKKPTSRFPLFSSQ